MEREVVGWLDRHSVSRTERLLWGVAIVAMVADVVLTVYGIGIGLREFNPIARYAHTSLGVLGILSLKGFALGIAAVGRWVIPDQYGNFVPIMLAIPWLAGAGLNASVVLDVI